MSDLTVVPPIESNAYRILGVLAERPRTGATRAEMDGQSISQASELPPHEVNDAVTLLVEAGLVEWLQALGTSPYRFARARITPRGRYELERSSSAQATTRGTSEPTVLRPPSPVGSPYGFTDEDWELVAQRRAQAEVLCVVLGCQFDSAHYDASALRQNLTAMFSLAVEQYNLLPQALACALDFRALAAGYGEHLFNEIARDIIGADIAVFELSDLNPNVMVEMGVALTWGVRVLPIKLEGQRKPPSDISGQTWADYRNSAAEFADPEHAEKLVRMVERAVRKKNGSRYGG